MTDQPSPAKLGLTEDGPRQVGAAMARNLVAIVVPCHRVIGSSGKLVGYGGGLDRKKWLLAHEGSSIPQSRTASPA